MVKVKGKCASVQVLSDGRVAARLPAGGLRLHDPHAKDKEWLVRPGSEVRAAVAHQFGSATAPVQFAAVLAPGSVVCWGCGFDKVLHLAPAAELYSEVAALVCPRPADGRAYLTTQCVVAVDDAASSLWLVNPYTQDVAGPCAVRQHSDGDALLRCVAGEETGGSSHDAPFLVYSLVLEGGSQAAVHAATVNPGSGVATGLQRYGVPGSGTPLGFALSPTDVGGTAVCVWPSGAVRATLAPKDEEAVPDWTALDLGALELPAEAHERALHRAVGVEFASRHHVMVGTTSAKKREQSACFAVCDTRFGSLIDSVVVSTGRKVTKGDDDGADSLCFGAGGSPSVLWVALGKRLVPHRGFFNQRTLAGALSAGESIGEKGAVSRGIGLDVGDLLRNGGDVATEWRKRAAAAARPTKVGSKEAAAAVFGTKRALGEDDARAALAAAAEKGWWDVLGAAVSSAVPLRAAKRRRTAVVLHHSAAPDVVPSLIAGGQDELLASTLGVLRGVPENEYVRCLQHFLTGASEFSDDERKVRYSFCDACLQGSKPDHVQLAVALSGAGTGFVVALLQYLHSRLLVRVSRLWQDRLTRAGVPEVAELCRWVAAVVDGCAETPDASLRTELQNLFALTTDVGETRRVTSSLSGSMTAFLGASGHCQSSRQRVDSKEAASAPLSLRSVHHVCAVHSMVL